MKEIFTIKELAEYLKMNSRTLQRKARKGEIPAIKLDRQYRFDKEQIDRWLLDRSNRKPVQILAVDDDPIIGQLFKDSLNDNGYQVTTSLSSIEVLELLNNRHFDLIFLDLLMPEIDGAELFRRIRLMNNDVPVVIITGYPDSEIMNRAMEYGPITVLKKPFIGDDILNTIRSFGEGLATRRRV